MPDTQPISWRSIVYGTAVTADDGERVGAVHEVLGSDADDIFHGLPYAGLMALFGASRAGTRT